MNASSGIINKEDCSMYDLVIVGAGPAGLSAGIYAARAKMNFIILEKVYPGGKLMWIDKIENYPGFIETISGPTLGEKMYQQALKLGAGINFEGVKEIKIEKDIKKVITENNVYETKTVIVASGSVLKKAGIPGEENLSGKGVSYCAVCDGNFFKNKTVAVIGEGRLALIDVKFLKNLASVIWIKKIKDATIIPPEVKVIHGNVKEIKGKQKVEGIIVENSETGTMEEISLDGVFIFSGFQPASGFLPSDKIKLEEKGFITTDNNLQTSISGIYACGDIRAHSLKQIVSACSEGAIAVEEARKHLL